MMFNLFMISDLVTMELAIYFLIFMNVMSIGVMLSYIDLKNARFLVSGNISFLLMHITVMIDIHLDIHLALFVAVFNLSGISFYLKAISEVFDLKLHHKHYLINQIVHITIVVVLVIIGVKISWIRFTTMLAIVVACTLFIVEAYGHNIRHGKWDLNTRVLLGILFLYHLGWGIAFSYRAQFDTGIDSIRLTINLFTITMMFFIIWINFSLFFANYYRLANEYKHMSYHDHLTELPNRRNFTHQLLRHIKLIQRQREPIGLISIDLNGFKAINDEFGHLIGDDFLMEFAEVLTKESRGSDLFARVGGDEFLGLLHVRTKEELEQTVHRLQRQMSTYQLTKLQIPISFEVGTLLIDESNCNMNLDELLKQLDHDLYEAKKHYKNQSK